MVVSVREVPIAVHRERLLIIGLDGADPDVVFGRLAGRMPYLTGLARSGRHGPLRSTDPPITIPAWLSMFTGLDPGELGVYGFTNRTDRGYAPGSLRLPGPVEAPRVWDRLSAAGRTCLLLGVPGCYPPWPIRGRMVASILAPGPDSPFAWPRRLRPELDRLAGPGGYLLDADAYRDGDPAGLAEQVVQMTRRRFRVARAWAAEPDWDLLVVVEIGPDRMHHGLWSTFDPAHRRYRADHPLAEVLGDYYALLDEQMAILAEAAGAGTSVLVVSDHGTRAMQGAFAVNEWLIAQGDLVLAARPAAPGPLEPGMVDWPRTRAWGQGGYCGRIRINLQGREPQGLLPPSEYPAYRADLAARLEAAGDEDGRALGNRVLWPERIYRRVTGSPPDLMVYFGDLSWRASGQVGSGRIHSRTNDLGPDDANHAICGIFACHDPGRPRADQPLARDLLDIAPLILAHFGLEGDP